MNKIYAFFAALIASVTFAPAQAQQEHPKQRPGTFLIYGPVHTIRDERATVSNENGTAVEGPRVLVQTVEYNEGGTKQEWTSYNRENMVFRRVETYDPDGRILEMETYNNGTFDKRVVNSYDEQKRLSERVTYRRDGSVLSRTVYRHQGDQLEIETWMYDIRGNILAQTRTLNDLSAHRGESTTFSQGGVAQSQWSMVDNPDGSQEFINEKSGGVFEREVVKPFGSGGAERVIYDRDGTVKSKERLVHEFDSYHNLIKTTCLRAKGDSADFVTVEIDYRTITYYGKN